MMAGHSLENFQEMYQRAVEILQVLRGNRSGEFNHFLPHIKWQLRK